MDHLIHRQVVELELQAGGEPFSLQHEVSRVCREQLPRILERLFDELAAGPEHLRWERLELDLGVLPHGSDLEQQLLARVREVLREALGAARPDGGSPSRAAEAQGAGGQSSGPREEGREVLAPEESDEALLRTFLETGTVPWWAGEVEGARLEARFRALLERRAGRMLGWLRGQEASERIARRVLGQFSPDTARELLEVMVAQDRTLAPFSEVVQVAPPSLSPARWQGALVEAVLPVVLVSPPGRLRAPAWVEHAVSVAVALGVEAPALREVWPRSLGAAAALGGSEAAGAPGAEPRSAGASGDARTPAFPSPELRPGPAVPPHAPRADVPVAARDEGHDPARAHLPPSSPVSKQVSSLAGPESHPWAHRDAVATRGATEEAPAHRPESAGAHPASPPVEPHPQPPSPAFEAAQQVTAPARMAPRPNAPASTFSSAVLEAQLRHGLPVDNAGVVLLHPFLRTFFAAVGLLEGKGFRDAAARHRAVCLLQWFAFPERAEDEHRMPLSKVLCGVPLEDVVPRLGGPTEAERAESEALLQHVVAQWTVLKNTSPRGLREAFLQRKGLLRSEEAGWVLHLEARPYDMLLERLPWGISHVRLSWMTRLLRVER